MQIKLFIFSFYLFFPVFTSFSLSLLILADLVFFPVFTYSCRSGIFFCLYLFLQIWYFFPVFVSFFSFRTKFSSRTYRKRICKLPNFGICLLVSLINKISREKHLSDFTYNSICSKIPRFRLKSRYSKRVC